MCVVRLTHIKLRSWLKLLMWRCRLGIDISIVLKEVMFFHNIKFKFFLVALVSASCNVTASRCSLVFELGLIVFIQSVSVS